MEEYLQPNFYVNSDHPQVQSFAREYSEHIADPTEKAIALYEQVRDGWKYNPYRIDLRPASLQASDLFSRDHGYCTEKANLLAAAARAVGIPSRLGFAKVRNHLGTSRLETLLRTDLLVFHGYCELHLEGNWVKATPAFNATLCQKFGVSPLEFNGREDSVFQQYTADGNKYMEYLDDYGTFADIPVDLYLSELEAHYPHLFKYKRFETEEFFFCRE